LPANITELICYNNELTSLPTLPDTLEELICYNNRLTSLPALPASLKYIWCQNNCITKLPELPPSLQMLYCDYNRLTSLPMLPDSLELILCSKNPWNTQFKQFFRKDGKITNIIEGINRHIVRIQYLKRISKDLLHFQQTICSIYPDDIVNVIGSYLSGYNLPIIKQVQMLKTSVEG